MRPCSLLLAAWLSSSLAASATDSIAFAPLPMEDPETVMRQFKPMLNYLEKSAGIGIRVEYSTDYAEILKKFREGQLDLAYLGPLPYVTLKEKYPQATPVAHFVEKSGKPTYTCAIVVAGDKVPLATLRGKKIALTQPLSTCGYLSTDGLLRQAGITLEQARYRYLDKHDEVALAVARGEFEAGGLKTAIGKKYAHLGLNIIAETAPLPSFALIANTRTMSPEWIERLRKALTTLQPMKDATDTAITRNWGDNIRYGAVPAADSDYDGVRRLRARADIPEQGNF